jgi:hypothetical protein
VNENFPENCCADDKREVDAVVGTRDVDVWIMIEFHEKLLEENVFEHL